VITDFKAGAGGDRINLNNLPVSVMPNGASYRGGNPFDTVNSAHFMLEQKGDDVAVSWFYASGNINRWNHILTLQDVTIADLHADNFLGVSPSGSEGRIHNGSKGNDNLKSSNIDEKIFGLEGNDVLDLRSAQIRVKDYADGGVGNDIFYAGTTNPDMQFNQDYELLGGDGDDQFFLDYGNFTLTGGSGVDTYEFRYSDSTLSGAPYKGGDYKDTVITDFKAGAGGDRLDLGKVRAIGYSGGDPFDISKNNYLKIEQEGEDSVVYWFFSQQNINRWNRILVLENVEKSSISGDNFTFMTVRGTTGNDTLEADWGNDKLFGEGGDDILIGGFGDDQIDGGKGLDCVDYSSSTIQVEVNLNQGVANGSDIGTDIIKNVEIAIGGSGDDIITASASGSTLEGGVGDDDLFGGKGIDTLYGGDGNDMVDAGAGNDVIVGGDGAGDDTYFGGLGIDTVKYSSATAGITVSLGGDGVAGYAASIIDDAANIGNDTLLGVENIIAGNFSDVLTGSNVVNLIQAGSGDDTIIVSLGADIIDGGAGIDTMDYSGSITAIAVALADVGKSSVVKAWNLQNKVAVKDKLISIENVKGGSAKDAITGNSVSNILEGGGGNDTLDGGFGSDVLIGGSGADRFLFSTKLNPTLNLDQILDFEKAADKIVLNKKIFVFPKNLVNKDQTINSLVVDKKYLIFGDVENGKQKVWFDADGEGGMSTPAEFAEVTFVGQSTGLTSSDFLLI
jgi:Ca2+-binding RTX toxin-like protein